MNGESKSGKVMLGTNPETRSRVTTDAAIS